MYHENVKSLTEPILAILINLELRNPLIRKGISLVKLKSDVQPTSTAGQQAPSHSAQSYHTDMLLTAASAREPFKVV